MNKTFIIFALLCAVVMGEDLALNDGRTYQNITVKKVKEDKMVVWHDSGIVSIPISELPDNFNWTPERKKMIQPYLDEQARKVAAAEQAQQEKLAAEQKALQEKQIAAAAAAEKKKHELPMQVHKQIFKLAEKKYFIDEDMQLEEYEHQKAAYFWIEEYATDSKALEYVKGKHPQDYIKMKEEYEYQTQQGGGIKNLNRAMKRFIFG